MIKPRTHKSICEGHNKPPGGALHVILTDLSLWDLSVSGQYHRRDPIRFALEPAIPPEGEAGTTLGDA